MSSKIFMVLTLLPFTGVAILKGLSINRHNRVKVQLLRLETWVKDQIKIGGATKKALRRLLAPPKD